MTTRLALLAAVLLLLATPRSGAPHERDAGYAATRGKASAPTRHDGGAPQARTELLRAPSSGPLAAVTRQGTWAYASASYGPLYLAVPEGPGFRVRVCGLAACLDRVSTDAGPELALQRKGRIGDLSAADFEAACGVPIRFGLCPGSMTILGRAERIRLPETDSEERSTQ